MIIFIKLQVTSFSKNVFHACFKLIGIWEGEKYYRIGHRGYFALE